MLELAVDPALRAASLGLERPRGGEGRRTPGLCHNLLLLLAVVVTLSSLFTATAYGPPWDAMQGSGTTATGVKLAPAPTSSMTGPYIVAVDPSVIPLGSKLKINPNPFGNPNIVFTAADTGGAIKGNTIDFYDPRGRVAQNGWGRRPVSITVLGKNAKATGSSSGPSSTATPAGSSRSSSPWLKLLLDAGLLSLGGAFVYLGSRRALSSRGATS